MKIKRFFAKDISGAIRDVRKQLGADAVILSNREVNGGIEIVAAVDYDEALFEGTGLDAGKDSVPTVQANEPTANASAPKAPEPRASALVHDDMRHEAEPVAESRPSPKIEWSQEPTLVEMRREMESLRGMMEDRLTGLAWGEEARRHPGRAQLVRELMLMGLSPSLCTELANHQPEQHDFSMMWRASLGRLANQLPVSETDCLDDGGIIALVGPTGVGKTTTIAKLAARYALRHGKQNVALVTTDSYRIGAHEQLRIYGRILDVPVHVANDSKELNKILKGLSDKRLVLIDTAGMSQRDVRLSEQFSVIHDGSPLIRSFLVLSATTQYSSLDETVRVFGAAEPEGCIITKTDEASSLGPVLSVIARHQLPMAYVANGQRVPEDIRLARANNLVRQAEELKVTDKSDVGNELLPYATQEYFAHVHG